MSVTAQIDPQYTHAAIRVRDLEAAARFYQEAVGLTVMRVNGDPSRPDAVFLPGLQLIRAADDDVSGKGALDHVGIGVKNVDAIYASLQAHGAALEGPVTDLSARVGRPLRVLFFRDPEGNRVELVDYSA